MLSFENTTFIYDPYPIGIAQTVFDKSYYNELVESFPPQELFEFKASLGNKYSLSEINNANNYHKYVHSCKPWHDFYTHIKREEFAYEVLEMLCAHNIDLGLRRAQAATATTPATTSMRQLLGNFRRREPLLSTPHLSARFEFSMLPADSGFIKPHTDSPQKIVTLVMSIMRDGEWNPAYGGSTEVLKPTDITKNFNHVNKYLEFNEVETVTAFECQPNHCVIFVKTFNSLHAVRSMTGHGSNLMRKTLTINIEKVG